jgi:outer membrane protein TolC
MIKFRVQFIWLFLFMLVLGSHAFGQALTLHDVLTKVLQVNPKLQSFASLVKARQGAAQQAEVRLNPNLGVTAGNRVQVLNLDQELEYPGKRRARTLAAAAEAEMAKAERQLVALELQQEAASLFYAILWGERNIQLLQQHLGVTQQFLQAATYKLIKASGSSLTLSSAGGSGAGQAAFATAQQEHLTRQSKLKTLLKTLHPILIAG